MASAKRSQEESALKAKDKDEKKLDDKPKKTQKESRKSKKTKNPFAKKSKEEVEIFSTDALSNFPNDLLEELIGEYPLKATINISADGKEDVIEEVPCTLQEVPDEALEFLSRLPTHDLPTDDLPNIQDLNISDSTEDNYNVNLCSPAIVCKPGVMIARVPCAIMYSILLDILDEILVEIYKESIYERHAPYCPPPTDLSEVAHIRMPKTLEYLAALRIVMNIIDARCLTILEDKKCGIHCWDDIIQLFANQDEESTDFLYDLMRLKEFILTLIYLKSFVTLRGIVRRLHSCSFPHIGYFIIMLLTDTQVYFKRLNFIHYLLVNYFSQYFPNIRKLIFVVENEMDSEFIVPNLIYRFPYLTNFEVHGHVNKFAILELRKCFYLEEINLAQGFGELTNKDLLDCFFKIISCPITKEEIGKLDLPGYQQKAAEYRQNNESRSLVQHPMTKYLILNARKYIFKGIMNLKRLIVEDEVERFYDFFKVLLYAYPKLEILDKVQNVVEVDRLSKTFFMGVVVSQFSSLIYKTLKNFEFSFRDCESMLLCKALKYLRCLEKLILIIETYDELNANKSPVWPMLTLLKIMEVAPLIDEIYIKVHNYFADVFLTDILHPTFLQYGSRMVKLNIRDHHQCISFVLMAQLINCCPNLETLILDGINDTINYHSADGDNIHVRYRFRTLHELTKLTFTYNSKLDNPKYIQPCVHMALNILNSCPNLEYLTLIVINQDLGKIVSKNRCNKVKWMYLIFPEKCDIDRESLFFVLNNLPALEELIINNEAPEELMTDVMEYCKCSYLKVRHPTVNDMDEIRLLR